MPRDLPVGNGKLLVNFDKEYRVRDIYYPYVGQENHTIGHLSRMGVWADGKFAWVDNGWKPQRKYLKETLVTDVVLHNDDLGLEIVCHDVVDYWYDVFVREFKIKDLTGKTRDVRLFFHHDLYISENDVGDTAFYDPRTQAMVHYKKNRWFLFNTAKFGHTGVDQWATGKKAVAGMEGTWRDAEDGGLGCNPIAQGSVDSTIRICVEVPAKGEAVAHMWMACGESYEAVSKLDETIRQHTPHYFIPRNQNYWRLWVNPEHIDFQNLPTKVVDLFKRSLLIIRTQVDNRGAIIAANDHDIVQFARDTYSYMWPRDGALVAAALTRAGYRDIAERFFQFCAEVMKPEGYLLHKYNPDKTVASSWHPWLREGKADLPIQEDETALVLWSVWQHFRKHRDVEFIRTLFEPLTRAADFLVRFRDSETNLPLPSHDLWEERYGVHLFTVASVIGGLRGASALAHAFGELEHHKRYEKAADEITEAMCKHLWSEEHDRFCRMATRTADGYNLDMTIDAAMYSVFAFGALPPNDPKVKSTMQAIRSRLWVKSDVGGVARYENDYYHQVSQDIEKVPGNPWFISSMWLAQYDTATARSPEVLHDAVSILEWVADRALPSGVLAEQVNPYTNEPMSVSPLTWSHATFVWCVLDYIERRRQLLSEAMFAHTITPM